VTDPLPKAYTDAFAAITADPNHELLVADRDGAVIGVLQLSFVPSLTWQGRWRAMVEGVRVSAAARGGGVGRAMMEEAIRRARARGCHQLQLTTHKSRVDAHRFYERLGFRASHEGMKLALD
jgi:GNAT superfamily N-acetyltransferase